MKRTRTLAALAALAALTGNVTAEPTTTIAGKKIVGASVLQYYVTPNAPAKLAFTSTLPATAYTLADYWGKPVSSGEAKAAGGQLVVELNVPAGYYEV